MEGINHCDIKCSVFTTCPMGDEHIGWFATRVGQEGSSFPGGPKAGSHCRVVELVPEPIVPGNPLAMPGTVHGVVAESVTVLATCRAGSILGVYRVAEPIPQGGNKLLGLEE